MTRIGQYKMQVASLLLMDTDGHSRLSNSGQLKWQNLMPVVRGKGRGGPRRERRAERFHWTSPMSIKTIN